VVGGGLSAARTCTALRRKGFTGRLTLLGAEPHPPYDRPPLSKDVLAGRRDDTTLPFDTRALEVATQLGEAAIGLDLGAREVVTSERRLAFDGLVIATGATPLRVPGEGEQLVLRTVDDALRLRARLVPGARLVLIGASWIGAEVATAARAAGCRVTCIEAGPAPLAQALGSDVAMALRPWWEGVDLRLGTLVDRVGPDGVHLADGEVVAADVVVTGIGVRPAVEWLSGSGLELDRGVLVDPSLRTTVSGVVAVGDVARRWSPRLERWVRLEHWDEAGTAAAVAAASLLSGLTGSGEPPVHDPVPYFWSDQFGHKVQYVGAHGPCDVVTLEQPQPHQGEAGPGLRATWRDAAGRLTAWLGVDRMRELALARKAIEQGCAVDVA